MPLGMYNNIVYYHNTHITTIREKKQIENL